MGKESLIAETSSERNSVASSSTSEDLPIESLPKETSANKPPSDQGNTNFHVSNDQSESLQMREMEDKLRRRLQFFFMNPIEKWEAKRRFPHKFVVQLVKIFLVTIQLCLFAHSRYTHVNYTWDNKIAFSHLFLKDWDPSREVSSYPPVTGTLAVYEIQKFYETLDYAYESYSSIERAIGSYSYSSEDNTLVEPKICIFRYKEGTIFGFNESYIFNSEIVETCWNWRRNESLGIIPSEIFFRQINENISFSELVRATMSFSLKTVNFKAAGRITPPDCYRFYIEITFNNEDHDGQMILSLDAEPIRLFCKGDVEYVINNELDTALRSLLNYFVIVICFVSLFLCCRAIYRAQQLKVVTINFFKVAYDRELSAEGRLQFLNFWYIMIIINDILIILGSVIKEQIERKHFFADQWNVCSLFLGTGNMLVWFGVLRYLGFFKTYNVVILTLKQAAPQMIRFLLCAMLIYAGFTFCGWLILGPYHIKFRSLSTTSECLFALINGDDMFATFATMPDKSPMLWWYSRIYLYTFISLFIYVIISLFISVIFDSYETIKEYYKKGFPPTDLQLFIGPTLYEDLSSGVFRTDSATDFCEMLRNFCCCKNTRYSYATIIDNKESTSVIRVQ